MEPKEFDFEFPRGDTCTLKFDLTDSNDLELDTSKSFELTMTARDNAKAIVFQKHGNGRREISVRCFKDDNCNILYVREFLSNLSGIGCLPLDALNPVLIGRNDIPILHNSTCVRYIRVRDCIFYRTGNLQMSALKCGLM